MIMKVYSGRQFGNSFNSGDEGLFQDANRPRDNNKFKLRPGVQTNKFNWRQSNSGISYGEFQAKSLYLAPGTANGASLNMSIPEFKSKYTASDFSSLDGYTQYTADGGKTYSSDELAKLAMERQEGKDSEAFIKDGMVYIGKSGSYMVEASAQFYRPTDYDSSTSYLTKMWVYLYYGQAGDIKERSHRQNRACGCPDYLDYWTVADIPAGTYLTMGAAHTYRNGVGNKNVMVGYALNLYRLS